LCRTNVFHCYVDRQSRKPHGNGWKRNKAWIWLDRRRIDDHPYRILKWHLCNHFNVSDSMIFFFLKCGRMGKQRNAKGGYLIVSGHWKFTLCRLVLNFTNLCRKLQLASLGTQWSCFQSMDSTNVERKDDKSFNNEAVVGSSCQKPDNQNCNLHHLMLCTTFMKYYFCEMTDDTLLFW